MEIEHQHNAEVITRKSFSNSKLLLSLKSTLRNILEKIFTTSRSNLFKKHGDKSMHNKWNKMLINKPNKVKMSKYKQILFKFLMKIYSKWFCCGKCNNLTCRFILATTIFDSNEKFLSHSLSLEQKYLLIDFVDIFFIFFFDK